MKEIKTVIRNINPFVGSAMSKSIGYDFIHALEEFDEEVNESLRNGFVLKRREYFDNRILYVELEREV